MAYSKVKLQSNEDKASSCFKTLLIGNMSDKFLPTHSLLFVSFRHVFIGLTWITAIPNSIRILYKTSLLTEPQTFLKSINSCRTASFYSHFFSSIWRMQYISSLVDLLRRNPHWWSPLITTTFGVTSDSRMLNSVLYNMICLYNH
jgi:hypothetical protein